MIILIYIVTGVLVTATLFPLLRHSHWLIRGMDFPRMQLAAVAALLIVLQVVSLDLSEAQSLAFIGATILCLAWQLWWILPYTQLWRVEVEANQNAGVDRQISILTANVLTPNRDSHKLVALVKRHRPDVLVTLESDQWWESQLASLETDLPETMKCPLDNLYGMHVYSRLPLHEKEISFWSKMKFHPCMRLLNYRRETGFGSTSSTLRHQAQQKIRSLSNETPN